VQLLYHVLVVFAITPDSFTFHNGLVCDTLCIKGTCRENKYITEATEEEKKKNY